MEIGSAVARERFFVEVAPGYVRLRHELGIRTKFGRRRLTALEAQMVRGLEAAEEAGESIEFGPPDPDDYAAMLAEEQQREAEAEEALLDRLDPWVREEYLAIRALAAANQAASERVGRGAKGMSERSRREMWRWVLSLPFDMLGDRPLWITLTYPGEWARWVPDGPTFEKHRRAFGETWFRGFGERPVGFWSKGFQLAEGRPHLHLLMKGPEAMPDIDYLGFQALTRVGTPMSAGTASARAGGGRHPSAAGTAVRRRRSCCGGGRGSRLGAPSRTTLVGVSTSGRCSSPTTGPWPRRCDAQPDERLVPQPEVGAVPARPDETAERFRV